MQKGTKRNLFVAATYAAVLFLGILLGQNYGDENRNAQQATAIFPMGGQDKANKVQRTLELITGNYVDSVDLDSLQNLIISEMVNRLDPHSDYLAPKEAAQRDQALEGSFEGIGLEFFMLHDTVLTVGLVPGGPASQAGLKVGDRLLAVNGETVAGVNISGQDLEKKIKGRKGSTMELSIQRKGFDLPFPIKVTRDRYELSSIDAAYLIEPRIAYVRISNFGSRTIEDFKREMTRLSKEGAVDIILDLRGNRGGFLSGGIELAGQFLPAGLTMVYTEGVHEARTAYTARDGGGFTEGRLAVLVDEGSASASEIVAGAVQDYERGIIVGRRSFGKGLIQEKFGFGDGSTLNLTVARYYTPLGRSIQKPYKTESQGQLPAPPKSFITANGKVLYAGGGIMPDIEVDVDSTETSPQYQEISQKGLLHEFVYSRLVKGVPAFAIENFLRGYFLPEKEFTAFVDFLQVRGFNLSEEEKKRLKQRMSGEIEALLGRYYFGSDAYFKIKNRRDPMVETTLAYFAGG